MTNASRGKRRRAALQVDLWMPGPSDDCAGVVRQDMLERGFALVDTPSLPDDCLSPRTKRSRTTLRSGDKKWWRFPPLARYGCWLEELLGQSLPEEAVCLVSLEFRHERAGLVDQQVDGLHADGSYIRSVLTLYGPTTIYRQGKVEQPVPEGQTLLMTAQDRTRARRIPCTLHRRPGAGAERAVIVCSFEPRQGRPAAAQVYRQVAQLSEPNSPTERK
jgi:hypothetical protein